MIEYIRHLEMLHPGPEQDVLTQCRLTRNNNKSTYIDHSFDEVDTAEEQEEEFNFQCDKGLDDSDAVLMNTSQHTLCAIIDGIFKYIANDIGLSAA